MPYIADLHVHSHYSRATSKNLTLETLYQWAKVKGIGVVGTGDFTHPFWFNEIKEKLVPDGGGFFRLKHPPAESPWPGLRGSDLDVRFCLTSEISSIYKRGDKVRKNHNLVYAPDFDTVTRINTWLAEIGNLEADGRPILGLPARDLLEIVLHASPRAHLVPAHVWTPWFSLFGSKSGYDSVIECFQDLSDHIFALETGLSSDPSMNWRLSALDRFTLISNSDAHSAEKLGREGNRFDTELSYDGMFSAIKTRNGFLGTLEFFPEEGKYHLDGHRNCGVCLEPRETLECGGLCPKCGQPLTIGVLHRIETLSDRAAPRRPDKAPGFEYIVPLPEILSELVGAGRGSKAVVEQYQKVISVFGNEFSFLREAHPDDVDRAFGPVLAEALRRMRSGQVRPEAGYDGEYGVIHFFKPGEKEELGGQTGLFGSSSARPGKRTPRKALEKSGHKATPQTTALVTPHLNPEQEEAISASAPVLVMAGPGTGKTRTLARWLAQRIQAGTPPNHLMALTFTHKAADEVAERLRQLLGAETKARVGTFHSLAMGLLRERRPGLEVYNEASRKSALAWLLPDQKSAQITKTVKALGHCFETGLDPDEEIRPVAARYRAFAEGQGCVDLSDIVGQVLRHWESDSTWLEACRSVVDALAVDEFQDINPLQYRFVRALGLGKAVFAIGDPDQSIYGFRGSDRDLFDRFALEFSAKKTSLLLNYRSAPAILQAARAVILHNPWPERPRLEPLRNAGPAVQIHAVPGPAEEAQFILQVIESHVGGLNHEPSAAFRGGSGSFADIAVLFRLKSVGEALLPYFRKAGVPVRFGDAEPPLSEPPFDAVGAALRLCLSPANFTAIETLLQSGLGWKPEGVRRFLSTRSDLEGIFHPDAILPPDAAKTGWEKWLSLLHACPRILRSQGVGAAIQACLEHFASTGLTDAQRLHSERLVEWGAEYGSDLPGFLSEASLTSHDDGMQKRAEAVHFLTFHAAKGLEFPVVCLAGTEDGVTPLLREDCDLAEERRLVYVAMTRAKNRLYISHAARRPRYGEMRDSTPSRFLSELPAEFTAISALQRKTKPPREQQLSLFSP